MTTYLPQRIPVSSQPAQFPASPPMQLPTTGRRVSSESRDNVTPINTDSHIRRLLQMLSTALGSHITTLLEDSSVVELMLNPDGHLWVDRLGVGRSDTGHIINPADAQRVIELVASSTGSVCSAHLCPWYRQSFPAPATGSRGYFPLSPPPRSSPSGRRPSWSLPWRTMSRDQDHSSLPEREDHRGGTSKAEHPDRRRHRLREDHPRQRGTPRSLQNPRPLHHHRGYPRTPMHRPGYGVSQITRPCLHE